MLHGPQSGKGSSPIHLFVRVSCADTQYVLRYSIHCSYINLLLAELDSSFPWSATLHTWNGWCCPVQVQRWALNIKISLAISSYSGI